MIWVSSPLLTVRVRLWRSSPRLAQTQTSMWHWKGKSLSLARATFSLKSKLIWRISQPSSTKMDVKLSLAVKRAQSTTSYSKVRARLKSARFSVSILPRLCSLAILKSSPYVIRRVTWSPSLIEIIGSKSASMTVPSKSRTPSQAQSFQSSSTISSVSSTMLMEMLPHLPISSLRSKLTLFSGMTATNTLLSEMRMIRCIWLESRFKWTWL